MRYVEATFIAKNMAYRYLELLNLIQQYEATATGRIGLIPKIDIAYRNYMIALKDYKDAIRVWSSDVMNVLAADIAPKAEAIFSNNEDKMFSIIKTIGRIASFSSNENDKFTMYEYTYPLMSEYGGYTVIFGNQRVLSNGPLINKLFKSKTSFVIIAHKEVYRKLQSQYKNFEKIKTGKDYGILGKLEEDTFGKNIFKILEFIAYNGIDISGISEEELAKILSSDKTYQL